MNAFVKLVIMLLTLNVYLRVDAKEITAQTAQAPLDKAGLNRLLDSASIAIRSNPQLSIRLAMRAFITADSLDATKELNQSLFLLSDGYYNKRNLDSAFHYAEQALKGYHLAGDFHGILMALNETGLITLAYQRYSDAERIFLDAFKKGEAYVSAEPQNEELEAAVSEIFNNLAYTYISMGNYRLAKDKILRFSLEHTSKNVFTDMIIQSNLSMAYLMLGDYDSALIRANIALDRLRLTEDKINRVKVITDIGNIYYRQGNLTNALKNYDKALQILSELNFPDKLAILYNNMGAIYKKLTYYEKATDYFIKAIKIKESLGDTAGIGINYNNLALTYLNYGNYETALSYFRKAERINLKNKNLKYLASSYRGIGTLYYHIAEPDSALIYYNKSLEINESTELKSGIILDLKGLGEVFDKLLNNPKKAFEYYENALSVATEIGALYDIAETSALIGELHFELHKNKPAAKYLYKGLEYAKKENAYDLIHKCSRLLTVINIQNLQATEALDHFDMFCASGDTLYNQGKTKAVLELQTRYETQKTEDQNKLLTLQAYVQKRKIQFLVITSLVLSALIIIILLLYRQKSRALRQIALRNLDIVRSEQLITNQKKLDKEQDREPFPEVNPEDIKETHKTLLPRLQRYIDDEKPYLTAGITLDDMCKGLGTNRSYLSQLINDHYDQNFNSFINELRIKEARRLLSNKNNDQLSIEAIGTMSGFSNKVTFHTHFRNITGVTPSFYRKVVHSQ